MRFLVLVRWHLYIESGPRLCFEPMSHCQSRTGQPIWTMLYLKIDFVEIRQTTLTSVANGLLNDALRLDNDLSALAATCSSRSVSEVQMNHSGAPGAHFTNDFSIVITIRWKIVYVAIYFLAITSLHRFAHPTTAQLFCHVKNIVTITLLEFRWEQN